MILFIDLFIDFLDLKYYFGMNNDGLKVYKQILYFTLILFIDLFIDFIDLLIDLRDYFDANNNPHENFHSKLFMDCKLYIKNIC